MSAGPWVLAIAAIAFAAIAGGMLAYLACEWARRHSRASSLLSETLLERVLLQLQVGVPVLNVVSSRLMERFSALRDSADRVSCYLGERGASFSPTAIVSLLLGVALFASIAAWFLAGSPVFGAAIGFIVVIGSVSAVKNRGDKRDAATREEVPDAIRSLEMSFRSGHSLSQTLAASAKESSGYLGTLFSIAADRLEMGATPSEALSVMCDNRRVPELSFVAVALSIQHQSGGSIGPVLESALDTVEGELKLVRNLRIQTAQAKLSATIVTIMPFILMALFSMMSPDFLAPFFSSLLGVVLLAIALGMQLAGIMLVRRVLRVDGVR